MYFENYKNEDTIKYSFNMTSFEKDTAFDRCEVNGGTVDKRAKFLLENRPDINGQRGNTLREVTGTGDFSDR